MDNTRIPSATSGTTNNNRQRQNLSSGNTNASRQNPGAISHNVGRLSSYGVSRPASALHEGDIIRGEISDLRNNEITVTLENNTTVKGSISDSSMLSIGQTAAFRLSSITSGSIAMDFITGSYTENELTIINQALTEASLPSSDRNQSAVKALMDNLMPITKDSIQNLLQQAYELNTEDLSTLALMDKNMMDVSADSVRQFSNYRSNNHQLLNSIEGFTSKLPEILNSTTSFTNSALLSDSTEGVSGTINTASAFNNSASMADFGEKLLNICFPDGDNINNFLKTTTSTPVISSLSKQAQDEIMSMLSNTPLNDTDIVDLKSGNMSVRHALELITASAKDGTLTLNTGSTTSAISDKINEILATLEPSSSDSLTTPSTFSELVKNIKNLAANSENTDAASVTENTDNSINNKFPEDALNDEAKPKSALPDSANNMSVFGKLIHGISETAKNSINNINQMLSQESSSADSDSLPHSIDNMISIVEKEARANDKIYSFLSSNERESLSALLSSLPISDKTIELIKNGDISSQKIIAEIKDSLPSISSDEINKLFSSSEFQKIFSKALLSSWTITPQQLAQEHGTDKLYKSMETQLSQIENLIKNSLSGNNSDMLGSQSHDMQSNIDFMKTLNQSFAYMQLPLKLQNQNTHADLYVYTQKDKLREHPEQISVLLHLDMDNLGKMDVKIEKNKYDINTTFSIEDDSALKLIDMNKDMLINSLNEAGYTCKIQVQPAQNSEDTVKAFIDTKIVTSTSNEMKRFSFDIRA